MKKKITAVSLLLITAALFMLCGCGPKHVKKTINAYNLTDMIDENGDVFLYMILADGWIMSSYEQRCSVTEDKMQGVSYKVLSDDVFLWQPSRESIEAMNAQDAVLEARILYSDPYGRCVIYGPNVDSPNNANIMIAPEFFDEIVNGKSIMIDDNYSVFYELKDKKVIEFTNSLEGLRPYDSVAYFMSDATE